MSCVIPSEYAAAGIEISKRMVKMYRLALAALLDGTPEGTELAGRFKRHFTEYAILSARYLALVKHTPKLRMHPDEIADRYEALDAAFDKLRDEKMLALDEDLRSYWRKRTQDGPVQVSGSV
jgi:hypothetical protein